MSNCPRWSLIYHSIYRGMQQILGLFHLLTEMEQLTLMLYIVHIVCLCVVPLILVSIITGPGSTIRMKTSWARTRKIHGPEATEIVVTGPRNEKKIAYVPPTNQLVQDLSSSSSSSESDDE